MQNKWGDTSLHYCVSSGNIRTTTLLLDAGANPDLKNDWDTPLETALLAGEAQVARVIFSRVGGLNIPSELQSTVAERQWLLSMLLSRIERNPEGYRYYIAVSRVYADEGNLELASQYFDQRVYVFTMLECGELGHTKGKVHTDLDGLLVQ